jgi:cobalt/nickel transport system permease protein
MHIIDGVLSATPTGQGLLVVGALAAAAGTAVGLRKLDPERLPQASLLSAAFFVVSLIQVPVGFSSVHLILSGLMGLVLGWTAFPVVLVALTLQLMFFSVGGLTTLGVNTVVMAGPAVAVYYLCRRPLSSGNPGWIFGVGFAAGATAMILAASIQAGVLILSGKQFTAFAASMFAVHLPAAVVEGIITGGAAAFLCKVRPELLNMPLKVSQVETQSEFPVPSSP